MDLSALSNEDLMTQLVQIYLHGRRILAQQIEHLVEIEKRRVHLEQACPTLFVFCTKRLGMSRSSASRMVCAVETAKRFPQVVERIGRGEIHLSALVELAPHLTNENVDDVIDEAKGKTKLEVKQMIAKRDPQPDVPARVEPMTSESLPLEGAEPLSETRFRLEMTISTAIHEKLARATELMRHQNSSGDPEVILERALDALIAKLEKQRKCGTVAKEVYERDGEQCKFVSDDGVRCEERGFLELDHVVPQARGGNDDAANLRVRCRAHNQHYADQVYGREYMERRRLAEEAFGALVGLGFGRGPVRSAVDRLTSGCGAPPTIHDLIREALNVLT